MKESCGCKVTVDLKTQFETIYPCEKHDQGKRFSKTMSSFLKKLVTKRAERIGIDKILEKLNNL